MFSSPSKRREKNRDRISLVILDMKMPGMDGCEVYDRLKIFKELTDFDII